MRLSELSVLVIGGTGFIGGALLRALSAEKIPTTALAFMDRNQADRLPDLPGIEKLVAKSSQKQDLASSFGKKQFSHIINLAAGGVRPDDREKAHLADGNEDLLLRLLDMCSANPPDLFIHTGSWSEYGPPDAKLPIDENHPLLPKSAYASAKVVAEMRGTRVAASLNMPFITLRLFHAYGPGEPEHRLTPYLIRQLSQKASVNLSPGNQVRDYIFIADVADAFIAAIKSPEMEQHSAYNLCTGIPVSVRSVCETVADLLDVSPDLLRFGALPARDEEASWVVGCQTRFSRMTNWAARTSLEDGLRQTINALQNEDAVYGRV